MEGLFVYTGIAAGYAVLKQCQCFFSKILVKIFFGYFDFIPYIYSLQ